MFLQRIKYFAKTNTCFFLLLTVLVFCLYGKSIYFGFTYHDDDILIVNNEKFLSNPKNIPALFAASCYISDSSFYYRPILNLSFAVETILFGSDARNYHITNIILFILAVFSIYLLLIKLKFNPIILKFICILAAAHPIFSSCAVWIPARNDTLLAVFICFAFINFINFIEKNNPAYLIFHCIFFTLAVFTKETVLFALPVYFLLIYCFNYKINTRQILTNIIILIPVITVYLYLRYSATAAIDYGDYFVNYKQYLFNALNGSVTYISKFITPDYIPIMMHNVKISSNAAFITAAVFILILFAYAKKIISGKKICFLLLWFLFLIIPACLQKEYIFLPHRLITASLGIIAVITALINYILIKYPVSKKYFIFLFLIFFPTFAYLSYVQADKYRQADVYWANAYTDAPNYHLTANGLAKVYFAAGDYEQYKYFIYEAYRISFGDRYIFDITSILIHDGNTNEAEKICLNILSNPNNKPFLKFGSFWTLGNIYFNKNDFKKAYFYVKEASKMNPYNTAVSEKLKEINSILKRQR